MLLDTPPDKICKVGNACYQIFYTHGQDLDALPIGTDYVVVYSPNFYTNKWHAVRYRVAPSPSHLTSYIQIVKQRELKADEITHLKEVIAEEDINLWQHS